MDPGSRHDILYSIEPEGTAVSWSSSDDEVAVVFSGIVEAVEPGSAVITGVSASGAQISFKVNVCPYVVTKFTVPDEMVIYVGETKVLPVTGIVPEKASPSSISWSSSEGDVVSWRIENRKLMITGMSKGKTEFVGQGSGFDASCLVTVKDLEISLSHESLTLCPGESDVVTLNMTPSGIVTDFVWTSSDESVATVTDRKNGKAEVSAGNKTGKAVITVKAGKYTLTLPVSVIDEDFQPYALTPEFAELHYDADKWPNKLIRQTVIPNGSTIWCLPSDVALYTRNESAGYAYTESHRIYTVPCLEDGSEIPESLRKGITIKLSDPASIAGECYVWPWNTDFWVTIFGYKEGRVTVDISTPKGKTYTCYYQMGVKNIAVSRLLYNNSEREFLGSTTPSGKITISKSDLSSSDKLSVDLSAMECQGYAPAYRGTVSSSNTSVAQVIDDEPFYGEKKAIPTLKITGTGTTLITIQNAAKTFRTSFTLEVK